MSSQFGLETAPSLVGTGTLGFPSFTLRRARTGRPTSTDAGRNVDRTVTQNAFSISNSTTFVLGSHSLEAGGLWNRNIARDGFGIGVNVPRLSTSSTARPPGTPSPTSCSATSRTAPATSTPPAARSTGHSDDFALFAQDDWRVSKNLTVFLGLRYELVGMWHEKSDMLANFTIADGGHHVVPNAEVATHLPPGLQDLGRTLIADQAGYPDTLVNADKNNFSPRVGFAWRLGGDDRTVLRGGFGLFHPTVAVQGVRDLLATNEFRYYQDYRGGTLAARLLAGDAVRRSRRLRQPGHRPEPPEPGHLPVQPDPRARRSAATWACALSYIGSTMRKLLTDTDYNTLQPNTEFFDPNDPESYSSGCPTTRTAPTWTSSRTRARDSSTRCRSELTRRWRERAGLRRRLHLRPLRHHGARLGQQHDRRRRSTTRGTR